jgi:hypothetical protein
MRLNQNGLSLIELTIAAALTAAVSLGAGAVMYNSAKASRFATIQNDIDRIHYLNLQVSRNIEYVKSFLKLSTDSVLLSCLQMNPSDTNCAQYNTSELNEPIPAPMITSDPSSHVTSQVSIIPHCVANGCDYVAVNITTTYDLQDMNFIRRVSSTRLPNYLFIPRNQIVYMDACPYGQMMVGIDYKNQTAICDDVTSVYGSTNSALLPLEVYDSGSLDLMVPANTQDCGSGYVGVGFSNSTCRSGSIGTPSVPPPPTTTTTTLPASPSIPINCMDDDPCTANGQIHTDHGQSCMCSFLGGNPHLKAHGVCQQNGNGTWSLLYVRDSSTLYENCM